MSNWTNAQDWERRWHGNCINSINEEIKQFVYASKMGLVQHPNAKTPYRLYLPGLKVLDIGSGPYSMLLKCEGLEQGYAVDPLMNKFPKWVRDRYRTHGVIIAAKTGEELENHPKVDEVWIYNCLQHVQDPEKIIKNARRIGKIIRLFEWIDTGTNVGHLHNLTEKKLNKWLKGEGKVENLNKSGCVGKAYYGIFV